MNEFKVGDEFIVHNSIALVWDDWISNGDVVQVVDVSEDRFGKPVYAVVLTKDGLLEKSPNDFDYYFDKEDVAFGFLEKHDTTSNDIRVQQDCVPREMSIDQSLIVAMINGCPEYNGHSQLELSKLDKSVVDKIFLILTKEFSDYIVEMRTSYWGPNNGRIYCSFYIVDFWKKEEHNLGHTDKLLLSINEVTQD